TSDAIGSNPEELNCQHKNFQFDKMIKIWSIKKDNSAAEKKKPKVSAAQIRVQKDLTELALPETMQMTFPDEHDLLNFNLSIRPDE
ncbi:6602_t:CDS:2, partial [Acaulospora morrowiae]